MGLVTQFLMHADAKTYYTIGAGLASLFLAWFVGWLYGNLVTRPKKLLKDLAAQGIPGHPFRPFLGQIPELAEFRQKREKDPAYAASTHAVQWSIDARKRLGPVFSFSFGNFQNVFLGDPALVRQAYVVHNDCFEKVEIVKVLALLGDGLVTANGNTWAGQRRLINPAFSHKEIKRIYPTFVSSTEKAMQKLEAQAKGEPGQPINMDAAFSCLTLDIICRAAFGSQLEETFGPAMLETLVTAFTEFLASGSKVLQMSILSPIFMYLPLEPNRRKWRSESTIRRMMDQIISARMSQHAALGRASNRGVAVSNGHAAGEEATDLLELMMNATKGGAGNSEPSPFDGYKQESGDSAAHKPDKALSMQHLMDNSLTFLFAGHETTSNLMTWTCLLLSQHPEWQTKAREEVDALFAATGGATPTIEQLSDLKVCNWIIHETLRLFPPAAALGRLCTKTVQLSDKVTVPKGCEIHVPIMAIHLDKELWGEDAEEFRPDRFAEGVSKAAKHPGAFIPFSLGPRNCIGQNFALAEAKVILALFLRRFEWKVSDTYRHYPEQIITLRPKHGMPTILCPRALVV